MKVITSVLEISTKITRFINIKNRQIEKKIFLWIFFTVKTQGSAHPTDLLILF
jgi:hypothetical protein